MVNKNLKLVESNNFWLLDYFFQISLEVSYYLSAFILIILNNYLFNEIIAVIGIVFVCELRIFVISKQRLFFA